MKKDGFLKFLNNKCTPSEKKWWLHYISDPKNEEKVTELLHEYWDDIPDEILNVHPDINHLYENLKVKLNIHPKLFNRNVWVKYAAGVAILALLVSCVLLITGEKFNNSSDLELVYNPKGEKTQLSLPDGSIVWLNGDSYLRYDKKFESGRIVHLNGEAYFDVVESPDHPFFVKTNDLLIKVLGTKFNVKSYQEEEKIETVLEQGKIALKTLQKDVLYLNPNERATLVKKKKKVVKDTVITKQFTSWKDGYLVFRGDPFPEIMHRLERWFDVEIELIDPNNLADKTRYTFMLHDENIKNVLDLFSKATLSADFIYEIKGKKIKIKLI